MPVVGQRDEAETKAQILPWLAQQLDGATDVEISDLLVPQASGFSNETFLFNTSWTDASGEAQNAELVMRSQPDTYAVFPAIDLIGQQYEPMRLLGIEGSVPVANTRWMCDNLSVIGQPFFVMDRLYGEVPADAPPFTSEGFVVDMSPADRTTWHRNAIEAMTRVPKVDWRAAGFEYLDLARHGDLGPDQRKGYTEFYYRWARGDQPHAIADPVWQWLEANWPDDGDHVELCWGDARPGNMMFGGEKNLDVIAIFDWEMVSLGNAESDLGWWLFLQRYMAAGVGNDHLEGLLTRPETIATWEELMGREAADVDFYERLAGLGFTLVLIRLAEAMGIPEMREKNPVADITAGLFGITT